VFLTPNILDLNQIFRSELIVKIKCDLAKPGAVNDECMIDATFR
jgi:hypothetical protein